MEDSNMKDIYTWLFERYALRRLKPLETEQQKIAAAGLDVLCAEPMSPDNPLLRIKDSRRLFITPHIAWASVEARTRLMKTVLKQMKEFFNDK